MSTVLLSVGDADAVFAIYDDLVPVATTAFRLCDLTSLLWRLELEGVAAAARAEYPLGERPRRLELGGDSRIWTSSLTVTLKNGPPA